MKAIARGLRAMGAAVPTMIRDLAGLAGASLIAYGTWLIYPPAGFITGGALLLIGAILVAFAGNGTST
jgi:hypothetical protein